MNTHTIGNRGEDLAAAYLQKNKFRILARNWRKQFGEIDIIAEKDHVIYFVEVKSLSKQGYSRAADKVNNRKRHQIAKAAEAWFAETGKESLSTLLVAEVDLENETVCLTEDFLL